MSNSAKQCKKAQTLSKMSQNANYLTALFDFKKGIYFSDETNRLPVLTQFGYGIAK